MSKTIKLSSDVEEFIHELIARAIMRAMENGTYIHIPAINIEDKEQSEQIS